MKKKVFAAACLMALAAPAAVFAADYVTGDAKYDTPDFKAQQEEQKADALRENSKKKKQASSGEALPITLWSEHATYDQNHGDFVAEGNVKIVQGKETILTTRAEGNLKTGDIWLRQGGTLKEPATTVNGEWIHYNFNTKTGEIRQIDGKGEKDYFKAPHAVIYPDRLVIDQGGQTTRCPAVKNEPCLLVTAKTFEIYPNDKMVAHDVKVYAKGKHIYSRDTWVNRLDGKSETRIMPRIGFDDTDNGWYIKMQLDYNLGPKTDFYADLAYYTKAGYKPVYGIEHDERNFTLKFKDGWEEDDDNWIRKERELGFHYKPHRLVEQLPLTYSGYVTHGLWREENRNKKSWHTEYAAYLNHDRIYLFNSKNTFLDLTVGKKWVTESLTDEKESTMMYYATLGQKLAPKWDTWVGFYREDRTSSLYDYGQPDMDKELRNGLRFKLDDKNTFTIINRYDLGQHSNYETNYRWTHRFCCWALELEYEQDHRDNQSNSFKIRYNFLNW